jgi:signal transduction histidine kinase
MVSHDLRNPLSIAKGRTELAYEDPASARAHLDPARDALARIDARLQDLLALARAGEVDATDVVSLRAATLIAWANIDTEDATLKVDDGTVEASERLLVQALKNLLENAVDHGGLDVSVRVEALTDGGFRVSDDGQGIPARERDRILHRVSRARRRPAVTGRGWPSSRTSRRPTTGTSSSARASWAVPGSSAARGRRQQAGPRRGRWWRGAERRPREVEPARPASPDGHPTERFTSSA